MEEKVDWPTNYERAQQLLAYADEVEWHTHNYKLADNLRAQAQRLLEQPNHREPPF